MHHYGEQYVKAEVSENKFNIVIRNHVTGAEITLSGPVEGIYEAPERKLDQGNALELGREIAHFLSNYLV